MSRKSIDIKFIIPEDIEMENIVDAIHIGLLELTFKNKEFNNFTAEIEDVLLRDKLVIIKETE